LEAKEWSALGFIRGKKSPSTIKFDGIPCQLL